MLSRLFYYSKIHRTISAPTTPLVAARVPRRLLVGSATRTASSRPFMPFRTMEEHVARFPVETTSLNRRTPRFPSLTVPPAIIRSRGLWSCRRLLRCPVSIVRLLPGLLFTTMTIVPRLAVLD